MESVNESTYQFSPLSQINQLLAEARSQLQHIRDTYALEPADAGADDAPEKNDLLNGINQQLRQINSLLTLIRSNHRLVKKLPVALAPAVNLETLTHEVNQSTPAETPLVQRASVASLVTPRIQKPVAVAAEPRLPVAAELTWTPQQRTVANDWYRQIAKLSAAKPAEWDSHYDWFRKLEGLTKAVEDYMFLHFTKVASSQGLHFDETLQRFVEVNQRVQHTEQTN